MLLYNLLKFVYIQISYFKIKYFVWKVHLNSSFKNIFKKLHQLSKEDVALRALRILLNVLNVYFTTTFSLIFLFMECSLSKAE